MPLHFRPGQVVVSEDGHRLGLLDEVEHDATGETIGIVIRREDELRGRLTRVPLTWVAGMDAGGVLLAVGRGEVGVAGSFIPIDERRAAQVRRQIDREGAGARPRVHPNWMRRQTGDAWPCAATPAR